MRVGGIETAIAELKSSLANFLEPDFELIDYLLRLDVLTRRQIAEVRSEKTVYTRSDALLDLLIDEEQCGRFLRALQKSGQKHVANFIIYNGGQKHCEIVIVDYVHPSCFKK